MPRQWKSPQRQFWTLQAALCLVLGAVLGLAAVVRSYKAHVNRIELDNIQTYGPLQLGQPTGWTASPAVDGATFSEPAGPERPGRKLRVWHATNDVFMSPLEYLVRAGDLSAREAALLLGSREDEDDSARFGTIAIAGWPGVLVSQTRWITAAGVRRPITWKQTLACTVLPSGEAVLLRLEGQGVADEEDEELVRRVASTIIASGRPNPQSGGKLELERGISLVVPDSLQAAPAADPFRVGRTLIAREGAPWLAVDLAPCVLLPGEAPETLAWKLAIRDPEARPGPVKQLDARTWLCERDGEAAALFPAAAYLRINEDGRALLAEFRWNAAAGGNRVRSTWDALAAQLRFVHDGSAAELVRQGGAARQLLPDDHVQLLDVWPPSESWQWYHESSPRTSSAAFTWQADALGIKGTVMFESSPPLSGIGDDSTHWWLTKDGAYTSRRQRTAAAGIVMQESRTDGTTLSTVLEDGRGRRLAAGAHPLSEAFVPGALLPAMIGKLPYRPLALQSEGIIDASAWVSRGPITLLLEPAFDVPRYPAGSSEAMRCWKVEVSGSGRSTRWYLGTDGRLQAIAFGGGVHLHRPEAEASTRPAATQPATAPALDPE